MGQHGHLTEYIFPFIDCHSTAAYFLCADLLMATWSSQSLALCPSQYVLSNPERRIKQSSAVHTQAISHEQLVRDISCHDIQISLFPRQIMK